MRDGENSRRISTLHRERVRAEQDREEDVHGAVGCVALEVHLGVDRRDDRADDGDDEGRVEGVVLLHGAEALEHAEPAEAGDARNKLVVLVRLHLKVLRHQEVRDEQHLRGVEAEDNLRYDASVRGRGGGVRVQGRGTAPS